jgi:predicted nucleotidyltransferase
MEMTMLDVTAVDLADLAEALEDHSELEWWFDRATGRVVPGPESSLEEDDAMEDRGLIAIYPIPSGDAYGDMEDFIARVQDRRARELLERAIAGRGAFRRFKDTLIEFPALREAWFAFHDVRMERRALEWLAQEGLVDAGVAAAEARARPDPEHAGLGRSFDGLDVAAAAAAELRDLYGSRLKEVILFGSWARDEAHPESDIDLLVVLDRVDSPWEELRRMEPVLWRHSRDNDTVVTAVPVDEGALEAGSWPLLRRVAAEGRRVA